MRRIIAATFLTLDGVMQAPGGPEEDRSGGFAFGGWLAGVDDDEIGEAVGELFGQPYDLLLGRRTYDIFAAYWPFIPTDPEVAGYDPGTAGIAASFNRVTKYVATHRPDSLAWDNTTWLGDDVAATLRDLKRSDGPRLVIQGSSDLIQMLLGHDLIDEFRLIVAPVVLGTGKRLFGTGTLPRGLKSTRSRLTRLGTLIASYEPTGDVKTGTFGADTPSDAEIERRNGIMKGKPPA